MAHVRTTTASTLKQWLDAGEPVTVLDVLPPEHHGARHIPGALNQCVYEVVFLEGVAGKLPDPGQRIVAYSASHRCQGAQDAAAKLIAAGYQDVLVCQDGLEGWIEAGYPVEGHGGEEPRDPSRLAPQAPALSVDPAESRVEWTGRSRTSHHVGTVPLTRGVLGFDGDTLTRGSFALDVTGLTDEDLADRSLAAVLVAHLLSCDFLLAGQHPEALFETTRITPVPGATPGSPNYEAEGQLTMRGVTRDVAFPLIAERLDDGRIAVQAHFDLDRTRWGVLYGSGRQFEKLSYHLVHDIVSIQLRLVTALPGE